MGSNDPDGTMPVTEVIVTLQHSRVSDTEIWHAGGRGLPCPSTCGKHQTSTVIVSPHWAPSEVSGRSATKRSLNGLTWTGFWVWPVTLVLT